MIVEKDKYAKSFYDDIKYCRERVCDWKERKISLVEMVGSVLSYTVKIHYRALRGSAISKTFLNIGNLDKALPLAGAGLCNNALILLLFLILRQPPFSIPIESPISGGFDAAFLDNFPHTGGGVTSPSISAIPLYSFELDTVGQQTNAATDGGTNDTLTMKGINHD